MKLNPAIASYSGDAFSRIRQCLDGDVLEVIARVARAPRRRDEIAADVLETLVEMHVLRERGGLVVLDTSVFLEDDIDSIVRTVQPLAEELADRVLRSGAAFQGQGQSSPCSWRAWWDWCRGWGSLLRSRASAWSGEVTEGSTPRARSISMRYVGRMTPRVLTILTRRCCRERVTRLSSSAPGEPTSVR